MKFNNGDKVLIEFFNPFTKESLGTKNCVVKKYLEEFTKLKNDGEEYYKVIVDGDEENPFFAGTNNMKLI